MVDGLTRRWDNAPLRVKGTVVIGIPLMPLVVTGVLFLLGARNAGTANDWMGRANRAETGIAAVLRLVVDADRSVSGFLLTHDRRALAPFEAADAALPQAIAALAPLVRDSADQLGHVRTIEALVVQHPLKASVDAATQSPGQPVPESVISSGRAAVQAVRLELAAMQDLQDRLILARSQRTRRILVALAVGGAIFGLLFGVLGMKVFVSGVVRRIDGLRTDAGHLALREALGPPRQATDELGDLTRSIHDAARLLGVRDEQARQHVRSLADVNHQLELARQELDQFFTLSLDLMAIAGADGRFTRVNAAWQRVFGWTPEELMAVPYLDFVHPDDRAATLAGAGKLALGGTVSFENRYRAKDGTHRWLDWSAVAVPASGVVYAAARDVTQQKHAAVDLERHAAELSAVNEELEAFSYSVSHDLRAPLRHVTGFASLLERSAGERLVETESRYLRTIVEAARRMGRLIDDLLAFSRMGRTPVERRRVSLHDVVLDARQDVPPACASEIAWTLHPLPDVEGDPALLRQVFVNLLSNAAKYSGAGSRPAIEVGVQSCNADETVIYVRDNGVGFDMTCVDKLFGVFQRLHSSDTFEGTGIGLASVRRIVHRHGGRVWAEGAVGAGATFYFSLPQTGVRA